MKILLIFFCLLLNGSSQELTRAQKHFNKLLQQANLGNFLAEYAVAKCYATGSGVEKDEQLAFDWCLKSAKNGYKIACNDLYYYYILQSDHQDFERAYFWFKEMSAKKI